MLIISGKFKGQRLSSPKGLETRPTSSRLRETIFNILQHQIEGADFLDLFAGSGAIGLEALSRGANSATFVDSSRQSIKSIEDNILKLNVKNDTHIYKEDVIRALERMIRMQKKYDLIYVDPPYEKTVVHEDHQILLSALILQIIDEGDLLAKGGTLFIEEGKEIPQKDNNYQHLQFKRVKKTGRSLLHEFNNQD